MIEELIGKGQQLDAINFAFEAGLLVKYPPVPLLKSFLRESKKASSSVSDDRSNSGHATVSLFDLFYCIVNDILIAKKIVMKKCLKKSSTSCCYLCDIPRVLFAMTFPFSRNFSLKESFLLSSIPTMM